MKKITLHQVLQDRTVVSVHRDATVAEAAKAMAAANKGAVLIVGERTLHGIFTERDLLNRVVAMGLDPSGTPVESVMTTSLVVGRPDESHLTALSRMSAARCRHLPVVEGDTVLGVVSRRDCMRVDVQQLESELERIEPARLFI